MLTKRFLISWLASSLVMFLAFYAWHGMFLTDFQRLNYPREVLIIVSSITYLVIGFILNKVYDVKTFERFHRQPIARGAVSGAVLGFILFIVTMVTGVSFGGSRTLVNLVMDVSWQVVEQCVGGMIVGVVHILVFDEAVFRKEQELDQ